MPSQREGSHSTTQAELLTRYFRSDGYSVTAVSSKSSRVGRLVDVALSLIRNRNRVDILMIEVYSGLSFVLADVASWIGKLFGIPTVLALHGGGFPEFESNNPGWVRRVLNRARAVVAPSTFLANAVGKATGHFVRVIPNVLSDFPNVAPRRDSAPLRLLWMRSFHPIYNPLMAVEAFSLVKKRFPDATLVMAGSDKGLEQSVRQRVSDEGLGGSVTFPGFVVGEEKAEAFSSASVYINTNTVDNSPVSVIEAWAYGVPVVSTKVGGIPDMVTDGISGLLVESGDAAGMAEKIASVIESPEVADALSQNGFEAAKRSAWDSVGPLWASVFEDARRNAESAKVEQLA